MIEDPERSPIVTKPRLTDALESVRLFERCTRSDLHAIGRRLELETHDVGREIVTQGDRADTFYLVLSGELGVDQDGRRTAILGPDDHFGELALLDPGRRSATVTSLTEVELAALSVRALNELLRDMPQLATALLGSLAAQLREARRTGSTT